jgi:uncharacterized protein (DUF1499 family)
MRGLAILAVIFIILPLLIFAAGQFGLLGGPPPVEPGPRDGKLKPPSRTTNSVSSQADLWPGDEYAVDYARIEPLRFSGDPAAAMNRLREVLGGWPGAVIVEDRPDYLRAEFETRWLRFIDDAEFMLDADAGVVHVRSKSRLGRRDFGVNRARIEALRRHLDFPLIRIGA